MNYLNIIEVKLIRIYKNSTKKEIFLCNVKYILKDSLKISILTEKFNSYGSCYVKKQENKFGIGSISEVSR
jgi:hypothetical protein